MRVSASFIKLRGNEALHIKWRTRARLYIFAERLHIFYKLPRRLNIELVAPIPSCTECFGVLSLTVTSHKEPLMTKAQTKQFLERLIEAGEDGIENKSIETEAEHDFVRQLIHNGDAGIREPFEIRNGQEVATGQQFVVANFGAREMLYVARGWAKHTPEGLTITHEGRPHLKLAELTEDDL